MRIIVCSLVGALFGLLWMIGCIHLSTIMNVTLHSYTFLVEFSLITGGVIGGMFGVFRKELADG